MNHKKLQLSVWSCCSHICNLQLLWN